MQEELVTCRLTLSSAKLLKIESAAFSTTTLFHLTSKMTIEITSDADLPKCLNTPTKQTKKARQLAHLHLGIPTEMLEGLGHKGFSVGRLS